MSATINTLGPNSRQIVVDREMSSDNIINAINTALTTLGWTLIDTVTSGPRNCIVKKVYSALNNDSAQTPTTKYMILRFDSQKQLWNVTAAEYWNVTNHTATNETFHNNYVFPLSLQHSNNVIYVWASARYAAFATAVRSELGPWQGVFEFEREAPEDIAGQNAPCFGWTSALTIGQYYGSNYASSQTSPRPHTFWVPRTIDGYTGWGACQQFIINTAFGVFPPSSSQCTYGTTTGYPNHLGMLGAFGTNSSYAWDTGKKVVSSLKLAGATKTYNTGRIYGLKVAPNFGAVLDSVALPIDSNGFFALNGTVSNHYILPISGGSFQDLAIGSSRLSETLYNHGVSHTINSAVIIDARYIYCTTTSSGIWKLDLDTASWNQMPGTSSTTYHDIVYDGGVYLYTSSAAGVTRIYIEDDSTVVLSVGGGSLTLALDDNYLYAARLTESTTPSLDIIDLTNFTVARTYTSSATMPTVCHFYNMVVDYKGGVLATMLRGTSTTSSGAATIKSLRVDGATATASISSHSYTTSMYARPAPCLYDYSADVYWSVTVGFGLSSDANPGSSYAYIRSYTSPDMNMTYGSTTANNTGVVFPVANVGNVCYAPFAGYNVAGRGSGGVWGTIATQPHFTGPWFSSVRDGNSVAAVTLSESAVNIGGSAQLRKLNITDGVALYTLHTTGTVARVGGQASGFSNAGQPTARILIKA